jgi:S-adenosylmethionine hydrolase
MPPPITLLTDFGDRDGYVGVMKGVIAGICPDARLIDLTHDIPPQNLAAARFTLLNAYPYFPAGTVHLVVVDPGVGTARRAIALQLPQGYLVGPDNGVLSGVFDQVPPEDIRLLN